MTDHLIPRLIIQRPSTFLLLEDLPHTRGEIVIGYAGERQAARGGRYLLTGLSECYRLECPYGMAVVCNQLAQLGLLYSCRRPGQFETRPHSPKPAVVFFFSLPFPLEEHIYLLST